MAEMLSACPQCQTVALCLRGDKKSEVQTVCPSQPTQVVMADPKSKDFVNVMINSSVQLLQQIQLFADLPVAVLEEVAASLEAVDCAAGETLACEGTHGDFVWVIVSGQVQETVKTPHGDEVVERLGAYTLVGEPMLLLGGAHTATFRTATACQLWRLNVRSFSACVRHDPAVWKAFALAHMLETALSAVATSVFGDSAAKIMVLAQHEERWHFLDKGEFLARQGDPVDSWYVVLSGELSMWHDDGEKLNPVGMLRRGDIAGELALITDKAHDAHLVAHRDTWMMRFSAAEFRPLFFESMQTHNSLLRSLEKLLAPPVPERFRKIGMRIAVLPLSGQFDTAQHVKQLAQEIARLGPLRVLDAAECERLNIVHAPASLEPGHVQWLRLSMWLEQQAIQGVRVLLVGDDPASGWSQHIYQECDLALYLCDGSQAPPTPLPLPAGAASHARQTDSPWWSPQCLCLVHRATTLRPSGTALWLDRLTVSSHFHVQSARAADFGRVARHLTGNAVGMALSGGGARGTAHAGIYRAVVESGIPVDFLAGTSAGALMTCLLATGKGADFAAQQAAQGIGGQKKLFGDYTLPVFAMVKSERLRRAVTETFGDQTLEDSWIPCAVVTTNLTQSRREIFTRGPIQRIALASISPPAIAKPILIGGNLHCDGGLVDNLPMDALKMQGCRYVVASFSGARLQLGLPDGEFPSGWQLLKDFVFNRGRGLKNVPNLVELLVAATTLSSDARLPQIEATADLFFDPDLSDFSVVDFLRTPQIVESGYQQARATLQQRRVADRADGRNSLWEMAESLKA
jgi:NTE family protein